MRPYYPAAKPHYLRRKAHNYPRAYAIRSYYPAERPNYLCPEGA